MIFYHIQECECLRPRGAEAVWEAADGKPDHPRRGWLRPHGGRNSAGYGRFRACGVPGRRMHGNGYPRPVYGLYTLCGGIPLGVSGLWRQRAARCLAGKTGRGGLQPAGAGASESLCQPHGGYPSRGCGAGAGRCGSVCCRGAGGHREHGGDRGPRLCDRRVRPPCARGHCQGRQHRARADEDRIRHRARTGRGIFTIGGTACPNF